MSAKSNAEKSARGISVRRKQYDELTNQFEIFEAMRKTLTADLETDIQSLKRSIQDREILIQQTAAISKG